LIKSQHTKDEQSESSGLPMLKFCYVPSIVRWSYETPSNTDQRTQCSSVQELSHRSLQVLL